MIINQNNCIGCSACKFICPREAITLLQDNLGFYKAKINDSLCINCGKCYNVCPLVNTKKNPESDVCYAAWNINNEDRKKSTSGGIATLVASKIINDGGVAYLCSSYIFQNKIQHIRIDNLEDLEKTRGSKYVQSFLGNTFINIKNDLIKGSKVLFVGTPCQVSGLKNYLKNEYSNLYTMDLICHGTPSVKFLKDHLKGSFEDGNKISFRNEKGYFLQVFQNNKMIYNKSENLDLYYIGFNSSLIVNDDCLKCKYATTTRVGEITIGDFWGLGKNEVFRHDIKDGCSVVIINNKKGEEIFNLCKNNMFFEKRDFIEAVNGNHNLSKTSFCTLKKSKFNEYYLKYGFDKTISKLLKNRIIKGKILFMADKSKIGKALLKVLK